MNFWPFASIFFLWYVIVAGWHAGKALPRGVDVAYPLRSVSAEDVKFLADRTYVDKAGGRHSEQQIFDAVSAMIAEADEFIVADMFLYNSWQGKSPERQRLLADEFTDALAAKKQANPSMPIVVVSDPVNEAYGGDVSVHFERLRENGIDVIVTDVSKLRDSNPIYSGIWRIGLQWFPRTTLGAGQGYGWLPHPFDAQGPRVTARTWLRLLNFKANHRKLITIEKSTLVTSANPHDGSSAHSNVAVRVDSSQFVRDVLESERAVAVFSGATFPRFATPGESPNDTSGVSTKVQLLTEQAIRERLLEILRETGDGDEVVMVMFYLADRAVVEELLSASERGANISLVLDPNKDAFGHVKIGVPNRPVADELLERSGGKIEVRWCDTHGEQCHSKMTLVRAGEKRTMILGSANLTKRNIGNYNLETNVLVQADELIPALADAYEYFDDVWENRPFDGAQGKEERVFTVDYEAYQDDAWWKYVMYRMQEKTGMSSF